MTALEGKDSTAGQSGRKNAMQSAPRLDERHPPTMLKEGVAQSSGPGRILSGVFETLDAAGIKYCVLHGYADFPQRIKSDVDCVIDSRISPHRLLALLHLNRTRIGAEVVQCRGFHIVLAGRNADGPPCFLTLDLSVDCELDSVPYYAGREVLDRRRNYRRFWVPAADIEFGCYLTRTIAKGCPDDERARRLSSLYREDPDGCERQVARFWSKRNRDIIIAAGRSGDWAAVRLRLGDVQAELRRRAILRRPGRFVANALRSIASRIGRVRQPDGLYLVLLGPDGAGKSSVIEALQTGLSGAFARSACYGFTPAVIHRLRHGAYRPNAAPHALPPRSFLMSVARAVLYWFVYYTFGYVIRHLDLARSTFVLNDRHFVDVLVDPKRYRYGGPMWLVWLMWRLIPKPDLIVLLNAPPEVLQSRKQEVPFEETARQRRAYLSLVRTLGIGHVVNSAQPLAQVAADVSETALRHLTTRIERRFGLPRSVPNRMQQSTSSQTNTAVLSITKENPSK